MGKTPEWAERLVGQVCEECQVDMPVIRFRRSSKPDYWRGFTYNDKRAIVLTIGKQVKRDMQRQLLLHELAHYLLPDTENHSVRFYTLAFLLYYRYGVPVRAALKDEVEYKPRTARKGYDQARALRGGPTSKGELR